MAPYHQHFFNLRIDPAIDGDGNSVIVEETVPLPINEGNPQGIGYHIQSKVVEKEGFADIDPLKNRVFKIINPSSRNPVNDKPVAYAVVPFNSQVSFIIRLLIETRANLLNLCSSCLLARIHSTHGAPNSLCTACGLPNTTMTSFMRLGNGRTNLQGVRVY